MITNKQRDHDTSPMTNQLLLRQGKIDKTLSPNHALKRVRKKIVFIYMCIGVFL